MRGPSGRAFSLGQNLFPDGIKMTSERRFKTCKLQGEWAELLFMARAAERGFSVSKPWGESQAYDVTVESGGKFLRVQVKSTASTSGYKGYVCSFIQTGTPPYRHGPGRFLCHLRDTGGRLVHHSV